MNTCVVDIGSHSVKAGFGDAGEPSVVVPSLAGTFKYKPVFSTMMQHRQTSIGDVLVGENLEKNKGVVKLTYPIQHGVIQDWKAGSVLIQQALNSVFHGDANGGQMHSSSSSPCCFALVESPFASRVQRRRVVEELMEYARRDQVKGVFIGVAPLLALYSSGQLTGVALDIGEGQVSTAAAVNGFSLPSAMQRVDGGATGGSVTTHLESLMRVYGTCERRSSTCWPILGAGPVADRELVREIKEKRCEVSPEAISMLSTSPAECTDSSATHQMAAALQNANKLHQKYPPQIHRLPDGTEIEIGVEALLAPEVLFTPHLIGSDSHGIADIVFSTVAQVDMEARAALLGHIVVSGATTLLNGFGARFLQEMLQRVPRENKVRVVAPAERSYAPWLGAAFLSQLSTFSTDMIVTREEYEEVGEAVLQKKLFV